LRALLHRAPLASGRRGPARLSPGRIRGPPSRPRRAGHSAGKGFLHRGEPWRHRRGRPPHGPGHGRGAGTSFRGRPRRLAGDRKRPFLHQAGDHVVTTPPGRADSMPTFNFASNLRLRARENPRGRAVIAWERGDWRHLTFQELDEESDALARGLAGLGMRRGMRVILMVPPSLDYFALVYALFKLGATIALVDPGIGRRPLLRCLEEIGAEAFVGVPGAHLARAFYPA